MTPRPPPSPPLPPPTPLADLVLEAERAEQMGDLVGALACLRLHLDSHPNDARAGLKFGRLLAASGERAAARQVLTELEGRPGGSGNADGDAIASQATRLLAELDDMENARASAAERWERLLADDIDDPQARSRLRALSPNSLEMSSESGSSTLVSPEGVETLRYRLQRELGRGASSAVYLARDQTLGILVALKVLHPQLAGPTRSDARRRFFSEARVAAALRHPGVIAIYDLDEPTRTLTMEYIPGGTLRARLRGPERITVPEIVTTARGLLAALAHVHDRGIVHGDLKPSNLLLRAPGAVVLADFGIAQLVGSAPLQPGEMPAGTPLYLAPEQFRGAPASLATDLYGAGSVLWEMVMGRPMRQRADLMRGVDGSPPIPVPHPLGPLIAALTEPNPDRRPASAAEASQMLP